MPITANITVTAGADPSQVILNDATNYGAETVDSMTSRTAVIYKSDGTVLGTHVFEGTSLTKLVEGLDKDYAVKIEFTIVPGVVVVDSVYVDTVYQLLSAYANKAFYDRHKKMMLNQRLENNNQFVSDTFNLLMETEAAAGAVGFEDLVSAQLCLDRAGRIVFNNKIPY